MYVAVGRYEDVSDPQKVAKVAQEGFVLLISEMPGFVAYYLVDAVGAEDRRGWEACASTR
jgi:hypothetical protein